MNRGGFPFWQMVFAVMLGTLLATAITAAVGHVLARMAVDEFGEQLEADAQREPAENAERAQERAGKEHARQQVAAPNEAGRDKRELLPQGTETMPTGTTACMYGFKSMKLADGRWQQLLRGGKAQPCRTR